MASKSREGLVTVEDAAELVGVSTKTIRTWLIQGLLDTHKIIGDKRLYFEKVDVFTIAELKAEGMGMTKISHMAIRALVKTKRMEDRLDSLTVYLGFSPDKLDDSKEGILETYSRAKSARKFQTTQTENLDWARQLLNLSEDYLVAVRVHTGDQEPWKVFLRLADHLLADYPHASPTKSILEHAVRNVRHASFLYVHRELGPKKAVATFPGHSFTDQLVKVLLPSM